MWWHSIEIISNRKKKTIFVTFLLCSSFSSSPLCHVLSLGCVVATTVHNIWYQRHCLNRYFDSSSSSCCFGCFSKKQQETWTTTSSFLPSTCCCTSITCRRIRSSLALHNLYKHTHAHTQAHISESRIVCIVFSARCVTVLASPIEIDCLACVS